MRIRFKLSDLPGKIGLHIGLIVLFFVAVIGLINSKNFLSVLITVGTVAILFRVFVIGFADDAFSIKIEDEYFKHNHLKKKHYYKDVTKIALNFNSSSTSSQPGQSRRTTYFVELDIFSERGLMCRVQPCEKDIFLDLIRIIKEHNPQVLVSPIIPDNSDELEIIIKAWVDQAPGIHKLIRKQLVEMHAQENDISIEEAKKELVKTGIKEVLGVGLFIFCLILLIIIFFD